MRCGLVVNSIDIYAHFNKATNVQAPCRAVCRQRIYQFLSKTFYQVATGAVYLVLVRSRVRARMSSVKLVEFYVLSVGAGGPYCMCAHEADEREREHGRSARGAVG